MKHALLQNHKQQLQGDPRTESSLIIAQETKARILNMHKTDLFTLYMYFTVCI